MEPETLHARLCTATEQHPDKTFIRCGATSYTYAEMLRTADELAAGLHALGVQPGDRVGVLCPNRPEAVELLFGCARLGAVQVPLGAFLRGEFLAHQIRDSGPAVLVTDAPGITALRAIARDGNLKGCTVLTVDPEQHDNIAHMVVRPYANLLGAKRNAIPEPPSSADATAAILYTSGTTGPSKGCVLDHGYHLRAGRMTAAMLGITATDTVFTALPLFHGGGRLMALGATLDKGASLTVLEEFHASTFITEAMATSATVTLGVGAMAMALIGQPPRASDRQHSMRIAMWAALPPAGQEAFEERFGTHAHSACFGQTECIPVSFAMPDKTDRRSLGAPAPDLEVAIQDDHHQPVKHGESGEIVLRPRHPHALFRGYWNNPEATLEIWDGLWHHTGDFGAFDNDGNLHFVDRKKDSLRRRGENVSSVELEQAIAGHPAITDVAAHAVPSELGEDDIKVCVVTTPDSVLEPTEVFRFFINNLPYYAVPRYLEVLDRLPRNAVARVMKYQLRERGITKDTWDFEALGLSIAREARRG